MPTEGSYPATTPQLTAATTVLPHDGEVGETVRSTWVTAATMRLMRITSP